MLNRALSIRSQNRSSTNSSTASHSTHRKPFSFPSLRSPTFSQPDLSKRLSRILKSSSSLISHHESAAKERISIATQLSEWGEATQDDGVSDISDKIGVLLSEIGEQEDNYAHALDDARGALKVIRNTERSVQPTRDGKRKIADEIAKLKSKEPQSTRLVVLEQELVRAEAEGLVAEAQLSNVTRQKLKEAYQAEFLATIERADKQIILARHGLRLLELLDDTPVVPGDVKPAYSHGGQARQILNDAEDDLREWRPNGLLSEEDSKVTASEPAVAQQPAQVENGKGKEVDRGSMAETVANVGNGTAAN
ncbi:putative sphingolipid long chain base-responsive protein [Triangularia verruculosa]|uniref:Sphingolipid long chain base-responsive protein n=1 Tax=Triangularia verruculosa TaxID=2587418 RepID=A0AAN7AUE8_9PEZI|nr:putative sphingolipid long chain base-responsive protein [Triangularia verruculosa]